MIDIKLNSIAMLFHSKQTINSNIWNYLTMCKQMSFDQFKNAINKLLIYKL